MRIVALTSGEWGGDFVALLEAGRDGLLPGTEFVALISTAERARSLDHARREGIDAEIVSPRDLGRKGLDRAISDRLRRLRPDLVCLCGYRYLLPARLVRSLSERILNSHPSLLPAFPGMVEKETMMASGACILGATVHLVDEGVDTGRPIVQAAFPNPGSTDLERAFVRYRLVQDVLYVQAVRWLVTPGDRRNDGSCLDGVLYAPGLDPAVAAWASDRAAAAGLNVDSRRRP